MTRGPSRTEDAPIGGTIGSGGSGSLLVALPINASAANGPASGNGLKPAMVRGLRIFQDTKSIPYRRQSSVFQSDAAGFLVGGVFGLSTGCALGPEMIDDVVSVLASPLPSPTTTNGAQ